MTVLFSCPCMEDFPASHVWLSEYKRRGGLPTNNGIARKAAEKRWWFPGITCMNHTTLSQGTGIILKPRVGEYWRISIRKWITTTRLSVKTPPATWLGCTSTTEGTGYQIDGYWKKSTKLSVPMKCRRWNIINFYLWPYPKTQQLRTISYLVLHKTLKISSIPG